MSTKSLFETSPPDVTEQLIQDFKMVVADAEALLKATAGQGGEAMTAMRGRVETSLATAKTKIGEAEAALVARTKATARATDEYVHENPWKAIGVATGVGLVVGLLIGRR